MSGPHQLVLVLALAVTACPARDDPGRALSLQEAGKCSRLAARLRASGASLHGLSTDPVPLPGLGSREAVLSLAVQGSVLRRYWARRRGVKRLAPVSLRRLEPLLIKARDELELGDPARLQGLDRLLQRLSRTLLGEVASDLRAIDRLLVLTDGLTKVIPFHALPLPGTGRPLAGRISIVHAPCLALALRSARPLERAVVLAPGAAAEVRVVRATFPDTARHVGAEVTAASLVRALGTRRVVHFAGHGLADLTPESPPELILDERQPAVTVRRITRRPVRASLVVLAACTTAYAARFRDGQRRVAETNLVEALLGAGAPAVIAASWGVKDRLSRAQMKVFYAHLRRRGPAGALAAVHRREMARIRPPHPRFWGQYAIYGAWLREGR
jgi:CHAT domain-containing protein